MARLPIPGSDNGDWGTLLNDYLSQTHTPDGLLKADSIGAGHLQDGVVANVHLAAGISADKLVDGATNKVLTDAERSKLAGIAAGATANASDAQLRDRSSHTGVQLIATVDGLQAALDAKSSNYIKAEDYGWSTAAAPATNDAAIASAIAAAHAGSRRLYLGAGTFRISVPVDLTATTGRTNGIEFFGASRAATFIEQTDLTQDGIRIGGYNHYLHDLWVGHPNTGSFSTNTYGGDGISIRKLSYSTMERVQISNNRTGLAIYQGSVFEPGTTSGTGNWLYSVAFADINVLRYKESAMDLRGVNGRSTGNSWRNVYLQNKDNNGDVLSSTAPPLNIKDFDDSHFAQLNIEDGNAPFAILIDSSGSCKVDSLHVERFHLRGFNSQVLRAYGDANLLVDGMTYAFSDMAGAGTSNRSRILSAQDGGSIEVRSLHLNTLSKTNSGFTTVIADIDDDDQGSWIKIGRWTSINNSGLTIGTTATAVTNPGLVQVGDELGRLPRVQTGQQAASSSGGTVSWSITSVPYDSHFDLTLTGDVTLAVPGGSPANGQSVRVKALGSGGTRTLTFAAGYRQSTGLTRGPFSIASGQIFIGTIQYSSLISAWVLSAGTVSAP